MAALLVEVANGQNSVSGTSERWKSTDGGQGQSGNTSSGGSGTSQQESSSAGNESSEKIEVTELLTKNIIGENKDVNWELIKSRTENLYSIWSTVSIDLAELNVPQDKINSFNSVLNQVTLEIKNENKSTGIQKFVDLYENVLDFYNSFDNDMTSNDKKLKEIKYNIIIAYENVEIDKWDEARIFVEEAQRKNVEILSDLKNTNSFNIKKINIILNQIYSSLDTQDKDIFYINYKNLIEEINLM